MQEFSMHFPVARRNAIEISSMTSNMTSLEVATSPELK